MNYFLQPGVRYRMLGVLAFMAAAGCAVLLRAFSLQVINREWLSKEAEKRRSRTLEVKVKRGEILDARGEPLAITQEKAQVYAQPDQIKNPEQTAKELAGILNLDPRRLAAKLKKEKRFFWVTRNAELEQAEAITRLKKLKKIDPGIGILPANRRFYPGGTLAANLLGFAGMDENGDAIGLEGLEYFYEKTLAGKPLQILLEQDAFGNPIILNEPYDFSSLWSRNREGQEGMKSWSYAQARGKSLKLTILQPLQYVAEKELEKGIKSSSAKAGCVVALDPRTGAVLAMASYPTFDPNHFSDYSQSNFRNRCVSMAYEPGSTFKVFIVAAALDQGTVAPESLFFCENGSYVLGGETIRDTKAHGWLSLADIIALSSNIGASKVGETLGKQRMFKAIRAFGFGEKTGIDFPGESPGIVRPPEKWSQVAVGTISFGQGIAVTPLQMAVALGAIANRGSLMKPYLVHSIIEPEGEEKVIHRPLKIRTVITTRTAEIVTSFMERAVSQTGTGWRAAVPGYSVAGKTGTAQKPKINDRGYAEGKYVSSFMGFIPARNPRLAMVVMIDEPNPEKPWGGAVAAPVFQAIAKQAMVLLKVPKDKPEPGNLGRLVNISEPEPPTSRPRLVRWRELRSWKPGNAPKPGKGTLHMPDLNGLTLRKALVALQALPVEVETFGSGVVKESAPSPGAVLAPGQTVRVWLERVQ